MYYELFIDVFFITNAVMDYFLLRLLGQFFSGTVSRKRSLAGSGVGAVLLSVVTACGIPMQRPVNAVLIHIAIAGAMILTGCRVRGWRELLQKVLVLYLLSFLMGGILAVFRRGVRSVGFGSFLFLTTGTYAALSAVLQIGLRLRNNERNRYEVVLYAGENRRQVYGFYDTGNHLREGWSGKPVSIVQEGELRKLLPGNSIAAYTPRYIPFRSVGCDQGVLLAVTLDFLVIRSKKFNRTIVSPVVAASSQSFVKGCQMIINPDLIDQ